MEAFSKYHRKYHGSIDIQVNCFKSKMIRKNCIKNATIKKHAYFPNTKRYLKKERFASDDFAMKWSKDCLANGHQQGHSYTFESATVSELEQRCGL